METAPDIPIPAVEAPAPPKPRRRWKKPGWLKAPGPLAVMWSLLAAITGALIWYSQTDAFAWDEGFHLLTAQLIAHGKKPYLDFFFPQAPLNAYWNAFWMHWCGEGWRAPHLVAAVVTMASVALAADLVYRRFPMRAWRTACLVAAIAFIGANNQVINFGPIGQGYALALLLSVAGMRLVMRAATSGNLLFALFAGMCAVGGATSTLLAAPAAPVFLLWLLVFSGAGSRWLKAVAFALGGLVPLIPAYLLWRQGPEQVIFAIFKYHMFYREVDWDGAIKHDISQFTSFYISVTAFLLGALAVAGFVMAVTETWREHAGAPSDRDDRHQHPSNRILRFGQSLAAAARRLLPLPAAGSWSGDPSAVARAFRAELYLCGIWPLAQAIHVFRAHPTFARYLIFCVPPMTVLAVRALIPVAGRLGRQDKPWWVVGPLAALLLLGGGKEVFDNHDDMHWGQMDKLGAKVREYVPRNQALLADEQVYLTAPHDPPSGMESRDSHKLKLPPELARKLHVVFKEDVNLQMKQGKFFAVATCEDDDEIEDKDLPRLFAKEVDVDDCKLFWEPTPRDAQADANEAALKARNVTGTSGSKTTKH